MSQTLLAPLLERVKEIIFYCFYKYIYGSSPQDDISDKSGRGYSGVGVEVYHSAIHICLYAMLSILQEELLVPTQSKHKHTEPGIHVPLLREASRQGTGDMADCLHTGNRTTFFSNLLQ